MSEQNIAAEETTDATAEAEPNNKAGRDAAKYRTRLREVEAQRDALEQQVNSMRGHVLEQHLSSSFKSLLQLTGHDTSSLFAEDGSFDEQAARALGEALNEQHPGIIGKAAAPKGWQPYDPDAPTPSPLGLFKQDDAAPNGARAPFDPEEGHSPAYEGSGEGFTSAFSPKN